MKNIKSGLQAVLEEWAAQNGVELKGVKVSIEIEGAVSEVPTSSNLESTGKYSMPSGKSLTDQDWNNIFSLSWKAWQRSLLEAARQHPNHIIAQANADFVGKKDIESVASSINSLFRTMRAPYRFSARGLGYSQLPDKRWDRPRKLIKVTFRLKTRPLPKKTRAVLHHPNLQ